MVVCLQINVGCTAESSSNYPVRLEFSRDFGATWHLLVPLCAGAPQPSALCSTELHPASIYFPGTTQGWRREVIHFGKLRLCGCVYTQTNGQYSFFSLSKLLLVFLPQVSKVPLVSRFLFKWCFSSYMGAGQYLHWPTVSGHVQWSRGLHGWHPLCL